MKYVIVVSGREADLARYALSTLRAQLLRSAQRAADEVRADYFPDWMRAEYLAHAARCEADALSACNLLGKLDAAMREGRWIPVLKKMEGEKK